MGSALLTKQKDVSDREDSPFVVDMPYQHLAVRNLFRPYGAKVYFSAEQEVTAIWD